MNNVMSPLLLLPAAIITISPVIDDKTSFLSKISPIPSKLETIGLITYLKLELRKNLAVGSYHKFLYDLICPYLLCRKQLLRAVFVSHIEGIRYQYGQHLMTDCS